ncbi:MAG: type II secretion system protein GspN [Proteobacteria bacterium]|nr:type II secretion system protein GspN [Pseudomonadota bacterium]
MLKKYFQATLQILGYAAFTGFVFSLSLFFVFPYHTLSSYLSAQAKQASILLNIDSLKPSLLGIEASGLKARPLSPRAQNHVEEFHIHSLSFRLNPFLLRFSAHIKIANGTIHFTTGLFNHNNITVEANGVDLSQIHFPALLWMLSPETYNNGTVIPKLEMEGILTRAKISFSSPSNQNLSEANGAWNVEANNFTVKQGTLAIPWSDFSPVDLPKVAFGHLKSSASIKKGQTQNAQIKTQSDELTCEVNGNIQLAKKFAYSDANFSLRLQIQPELLKRLGILGSAVSLLPVDPQDAQWRSAQFSGQLSRLKMK